MAGAPLERKRSAAYPVAVSATDISTRRAADVLDVSVPTVRKMLTDGRLTGRTEPIGSRFRWLVSAKSVETCLATRDSDLVARRGKRITIAELRDEVAQLRAELGSLTQSHPSESPADSGRRPEVVELREALLQQRALMAAWQAADDARAEVVQYLLKAVAAGERADASRRDGLAAAEAIIGQFVTPSDVGEAAQFDQG